MTALSLLVLVANVPAGLAAELPADELLKRMRAAYQGVATASLAVRIRRENPEGTDSGLLTLDYARPNRIRYASRIGTVEIRRYCDGKQVVTVRPGMRDTEIKIDVDTLGGQIPGNLEWLCFFDWKRQLSTAKGANMFGNGLKVIPAESWRKRSWIVLEETASNMGIFVRYFIDPKTFFIWRCDVHRTSDNKLVTMTEVQKLATGVPLAAKLFVPPPEKISSGSSGP
jgi:outer membrane lipoprotein-sorting protein